MAGPSILLVDDEGAVRNLVAGVLSRKYEVLQAANGSEALELFRQHCHEITLLLTDIAMPEMDGIELAERARELKSDLKILFLSGYYREDERSVKLAERGAAFLAKPFSPTALLARIDGMLGGQAR
jgi:DNA-binding response OmpR family regulator